MADLIDRHETLKAFPTMPLQYAAIVCEVLENAPAVNRWISCEDELPERDTNVLIYYPAWQDAPVQTAHIMSDGSCWEFSDGEFYPSMKDITHWMPLPPLPEPPEKE